MDEQRDDHYNKKDPLKRTDPINYRPITCLQMMWKILTVQFRDNPK